MNHFKLQATSAAVIAALSQPVFATDAPTIFGKAHLSFGSVSEDTASSPETSSTEVSSHASRIGVKGAIDTDSSLKVVYRLVWQIDMSDVAKDSTSVSLTDTDSDGIPDSASAKDSSNISSREQYVGLKDSWGEVRIGRDDSPYKKAGKKNVEHLSDTWADYNNIISKSQDLRNDDSIGFWSKIGPGKLGIQYGAGDDKAGSGQENESDVISLAYDMKMGAIGFALAYQDIGESSTGAQDGSEGTKIVLGYKLGDTQLGLISESVDDEVNGSADEDNLLGSIKHKIGDGAVILTYGSKDVDGVSKDARMTAVAYQHKLNKSTTLYGLWADGADGGLSDASKLSGDGQAIVAGVIAKF